MKPITIIVLAIIVTACAHHPPATSVDIGIRDGQTLAFKRQVDINGTVTIEAGQVTRDHAMLYSTIPDDAGRVHRFAYDLDHGTLSINGEPPIWHVVAPFQRAGLLEDGYTPAGAFTYRRQRLVAYDINQPNVTGHCLYDPDDPALPVLINVHVTSPLKHEYKIYIKYF